MELDKEALRTACYNVARNTLWEQHPVSVEEIEDHADSLYKIVIEYVDFIKDQERDPNILVRAVRYLGHKHAIPPMRDDVRWFSDMLEVLVELVCPNSESTSESVEFFNDIEDGIARSRSELMKG